MAIVRNINGTNDNYPPSGYSSWKDYWEQKKGRKFSDCSCLYCHNKAEVGGHVKRAYGSNKWYIIPICYYHNNPAFLDTYEVRDNDLLSVG